MYNRNDPGNYRLRVFDPSVVDEGEIFGIWKDGGLDLKNTSSGPVNFNGYLSNWLEYDNDGTRLSIQDTDGYAHNGNIKPAVLRIQRKFYDVQGTPKDAGQDWSEPQCIHASSAHYGNKANMPITGLFTMENCNTSTTMHSNGGISDAVALAGFSKKSGYGYGDACGVLGVAWQEGTTYGGVMAMETIPCMNRYKNWTSGKRDRLHAGIDNFWTVGLHVMSGSSAERATAGIAIEGGTGKHGFWNGLMIDGDTFKYDYNVTPCGEDGTVGINMTWPHDGYGNIGIKFGYANYHMYSTHTLNTYAQNGIFQQVGNGSYYRWHDSNLNEIMSLYPDSGNLYVRNGFGFINGDILDVSNGRLRFYDASAGTYTYLT